MGAFIHSILQTNGVVSADGDVVYDLPVNPLSVILLHVSPLNETSTIGAYGLLEALLSAVDNVRVDSQSLTLDGVTTSGGSWVQRRWVVPVVSESTPFEIVVEAADEAGNVAIVRRTLTAEPSTDVGPPVVSIVCPFDGDGCADGIDSDCDGNPDVDLTQYFDCTAITDILGQAGVSSCGSHVIDTDGNGIPDCVDWDCDGVGDICF